MAEGSGSVRLLTALDGFKSGPAESGGHAEQHAASLSTREIEILRLLAAGHGNRQISEELMLSSNTVLRHITNAYRKLGAANRADAIRLAHLRGFVED